MKMFEIQTSSLILDRVISMKLNVIM